MRLRITSKAPSPTGIRARELGSGAGAVRGVKVKSPEAPSVLIEPPPLVAMFVVWSVITNAVPQTPHTEGALLHVYWSVGRSAEGSVMLNVDPSNDMVRVGDGNVTSGAVGPPVKVAANESA